MAHRFALLAAAITGVTSLAAQLPARTDAPRLWSDEALAGWALPIAGVKATPKYYTEREYYAAPVDEVRTYPVYIKSREPEGYRDWIRKQGPQPLIDPATLTSEANWLAAGREVFDGLHLAKFRTADPRAFRWADDPDLMARQGVTVAADGTIPGVRWLIDHDRQLKITLAECSGCHTRVLSDGSTVRGAQRNLQWGSLPGFCFDALDEIRRREGRTRSAGERAYSSYGVPWLKDDVNATLKTMTAEQVDRVDGEPFLGTFVRFNASPWFTTRISDLIGVKDRRYLDATGTHRNRGPEDIAPTLDVARLGCDLPANDERADYLRATLAPGPDGMSVATPAAVQDSSMLTRLAGADCLLVRQPHAPAARAGEPCTIIKLVP